jgi:hypothetical protein
MVLHFPQAENGVGTQAYQQFATMALQWRKCKSFSDLVEKKVLSLEKELARRKRLLQMEYQALPNLASRNSKLGYTRSESYNV